MRFLKHIRNRSHNKSADLHISKRHHGSPGHPRSSSLSLPPGLDYTSRLPRHVLTKIFSHVCPHALDDSYNSSEESMTENGCMLCDMRDLAHCALVCKRWFRQAQPLL